MKRFLPRFNQNMFLAVLATSVLTIFFFININFVIDGLNGLLDFGSFVASGQLANQGKNPYANDSPLIFSVYFPGIDHSGSAPNLNPPISVLIFQQIANVSTGYSVQIWRILSVIFYVWAIYLLTQSSPEKPNPNFFWRTIWALSLAALWHTIQLGQIYAFLLLLVTGIIINLEKGKNLTAGIILGILIAIKPNFIFWATALGIAGYWSIFFSAGVTSLFISLIPVYFYGFKIYQQWIEAAKLYTPDLLIFPGNNSFQGLAAHFNSVQTGTVVSVILAIAAIIAIHRYKPSSFNTSALSLVVSLLISPIAWTGYAMLTLPIFLKSAKWERTLWIASFIFAVPFFFVLAFYTRHPFNYVFWGWFYGWGLLLVLLQICMNITAVKTSASSIRLT